MVHVWGLCIQCEKGTVKDHGTITSTVVSMVVLKIDNASSVSPFNFTLGRLVFHRVVYTGIGLALSVLIPCWVFWPRIGSRLVDVRQWSSKRRDDIVMWHAHQTNSRGCVCPWWCAWSGWQGAVVVVYEGVRR